MNSTLIIISSICAALIVLILALNIIPRLMKNSAISLRYDHLTTINWINDNANQFINACFCGAIRTGKTTLMSGICNILADTMEERINNIVEDVPIIFYDVDFNEVDEIIKAAYLAEEPASITTKRLIAQFEPFKLKYDSGLSIGEGATEVRQYVDAYEALLRDNYVYAIRGDFTRESNGQRAQVFDRSMLDIKDLYKQKRKPIGRYSIIFEDEKTARSGQKSTDFQKVAKEDSGATTWATFAGHLGMETIYHLAASQEFERDVKEHRALATAILYTRSREECNPHKLKTAILRFKYHRLLKKRDKELAKSKNPDEYLKENSKLKYKIFLAKQKIKHQRAKNYIKYNVDIYYNTKDADKNIEKCAHAINVTFTFKIKQCYGCVSRYSFAFLQDKLEENATPDALQDNPIDFSSDEAMIHAYLEREEDEKETKNNKKGEKKK